MIDLAIYGAGGFGREVALMVRQINEVTPRWNLLGFFDDIKEKDSIVDGLPILGNCNDINKANTSLSMAIAIADPITRQAIVSSITNKRISLPMLVHPSANIGSHKNEIGKGCIVTAGCIFTTGITLSDFVIVNLGTTIGHDVKIGKFSSIMPGCNISGNVRIGEHTLIGTGAKLLQNISIGNNCKLGAGAVITKSFGNGVTVVGVPGKAKAK
jgi:sugar O-acyltransferase (sialic acid O-acetyltransferase NeuD family)